MSLAAGPSATASGEDLLTSALLAAFVELPAAALSLLIAAAAQDTIARNGLVRHSGRSAPPVVSGEHVASGEPSPGE